MSKKITRTYLDYASATPVDPAVLRVVKDAQSKIFGNPGALHTEGRRAKALLNDARARVAAHFGVHEDEIIFTSGATESDNLALSGVIEGYLFNNPVRESNPHIVISAIEHSAVLEQALFFQKFGIDVTFVPVDTDGVIDMAAFKKSLRKETIFVSVMYANNEIGTIEPIADIAKAIRHFKKINKTESQYPLFHTDATQAINYLPVRIPPLGVDLLTCNGGKIYGPKGVGMLYKKRGIPFGPQMKGGSQEFGYRPGTENVPLIAGFARALEIVSSTKEKEYKRISALKSWLINEIQRIVPGVIFNGHPIESLPNIINITVPGIESDYLVLSLEAKGYALSSKSACKSGDGLASHVIMELKKGIEETSGSLRISLGRHTAKRDLVGFLKMLVHSIDLHNQSITFLEKSR